MKFIRALNGKIEMIQCKKNKSNNKISESFVYGTLSGHRPEHR